MENLTDELVASVLFFIAGTLVLVFRKTLSRLAARSWGPDADWGPWLPGPLRALASEDFFRLLFPVMGFAFLAFGAAFAYSILTA